MNYHAIDRLRWAAVIAATYFIAVAGQAATARVSIPNAKGGSGKEAAVAIHLQSKDEAGCMQFALTYDPAILEVKSVEAGPALPAGAMVEHNKDEAGWLRAGFVCSPSSPGFKGDGAVLNVVFTVKGESGQKSPLKLEKVLAWESADPEMLVTTEAGEFTVGSAFPWVWVGAAAAALVLAVAVLLFLRRRGRSRSGSGSVPLTHAAPPVFAPDFQHACTKCGGVIRLPGSMRGQVFQCAGCGTNQLGGQ